MNSTMVTCFLESAQMHSISKAAKKLYFTQQTVSRNVSALEKELGRVLLLRGGAGVELTEAGAYYYALFQNSIYNDQCMRSNIKAFYESHMSLLRLGFSEWVNPYGEIYDAIIAYKKDHPGLHISVRVYDNTTLAKLLDDGSIDAAIFSEGHLPDTDIFDAFALCPESIALVGPDDVIGFDLPEYKRKKRWNYPFLITPSNNRGYMENMAFCRQEVSRLSPPIERIQLSPNFASQSTLMYQRKYITFCDQRFGFIHDMKGMACEPLQVKSSLFCCTQVLIENTNVKNLIEHMQIYLNQ